MRVGDLVRITAGYISPVEPILGLIIRPTSLLLDGDQIAGEMDWWLLWNDQHAPFPEEDLEVVSEAG